MKKIFQLPRADKLLIFATVVASLRLMLINATAVGVDVGTWPWFHTAEVWSGVAFAVLEGVALAYVSKRWRKLRPTDWVSWLYWVILAGGQLVLLLAITWVTGMAFMTVRQGVLIDDILSPTAAALWSMTVAGINPLIVVLIGIVEDDAGEARAGWKLPEHIEAAAIVANWAEMYGREPTVPDLVKQFKLMTGREIEPESADGYILAWRSENGVRGRRPVGSTNGVG